MSLLNRIFKWRNENDLSFQEAVAITTKKLIPLGYVVTESKDLGMHKYALLTNNDKFSVSILYDRSYMECHILPDDKHRLDLITLANYVNGQVEIYNLPAFDRLIIPIRHFTDILYKEHTVISAFLSSCTKEELHKCSEYCGKTAGKMWDDKFKEEKPHY